MAIQRASSSRVSSLTSPRLITATLFLLFLLNSAVWAQTPIRFIAVGDTRGTSTTDPINTVIVSELANEIVRQNASFVIVPGDLAYSGSATAFQTWKALMAPVYNAGIKVLPILGNHDANAVAAWQQVFGPDIPDNGPAGELDRTYSYSRDNVLVLGLDTYVNTGRINQTWVNDVLAANTLPHLFVFGHMPAFKANHTDCLDDYQTERNAFWNSLRNAKVRAYFSGHDHFYDHARIDDGDGNANNDVHQLIVGSGGAPFHTSYSYNGVNSPWTPLNQFHEAQYGYTLVEINGPTVTMTFFHRTGTNMYASTSDVWSYTINGAPIAVSSAVPASGTAPLTVSFNGSGSYDPDGTVVGYVWNFGDSASGSGTTVSHTYASAGTYTAILTVTDNSGLTGSTSVPISVTDAPVMPAIHVGDLDAAKSLAKKSWTAKATITVHDSAEKVVSGVTVSGNWDTGGASSCTTSRKGVCTVSRSGIPLLTASTLFTITGITKAGTTYQQSANHDSDGDSDGTEITITK